MPIFISDGTGTLWSLGISVPQITGGEIDLIGWHKDILCFVEVKTRTTRNVKPAQTAVDRDKRRELMAVAREYLRHLPASCPWRLEVIAVYYDRQSNQPQVELFQN